MARRQSDPKRPPWLRAINVLENLEIINSPMRFVRKRTDDFGAISLANCFYVPSAAVQKRCVVPIYFNVLTCDVL